MTRKGIKIREVEEGSLGGRIGLAAGDEVLAVNGHSITDELGLKFYLSEELVELAVRKSTGAEMSFALDLSGGDRLGVEVEDFRTRTCNNACLFCFIDQLPPGVRPTLMVKDDDYRLSVLWQIATPVWQAAFDIPPLIWWNNLGRIFLAVDDLGCHELLG